MYLQREEALWKMGRSTAKFSPTFHCYLRWAEGREQTKGETRLQAFRRHEVQDKPPAFLLRYRPGWASSFGHNRIYTASWALLATSRRSIWR